MGFASSLGQSGISAQANEPTILRYSASLKAFKVWVVTLPSAPVDSMNRAAASSAVNSKTCTRGTFPW